eukprot:364857-Chlamydomonas_euryale.AAC.15
MPGKLRQRVRSVSPTGDIASTTPARLLGRQQALALEVVAHRAARRVLLAVIQQRRHHAAREHVVDELQEALVRDVRCVELLEVVAERRLVVAARQRDLKHLAAARVRRQPRQALLAGAADADQQQVALRQAHRAADTHEVLERVLKEHQVHGLALRVVQRQHLLKYRLNCRVVAQVGVQPQRLALDLLAAQRAKRAADVAKKAGVGERVLCAAREARLHQLLHLGQRERLVLWADEAVVEHTQRLVAPQPQERLCIGEHVGRRQQQALIHARQVAQVEHVVEARRRRRQLLADVVVQLERRVGQLLAHHDLDLLARQLCEVAGEDGLVDGAEVVGRGELDAKHVEQRHEARVDRVARAAGRAHRADHLHVLHVLPAQLLAAVVQPLALNEQLEQRDGLLRAVAVDARHVEVVDEHEQALAHRRAISVLGALLRRVLDRALHIERRRARREVHVEIDVDRAIEAAKVVVDRDGLGGARLAHKERRLATRHHCVQQPRGPDHIDRRHQDLAELPVCRRLVVLHVGAPRLPAQVGRVEAVLVQRARRQLRRRHTVAVDDAHAGDFPAATEAGGDGGRG